MRRKRVESVTKILNGNASVISDQLRTARSDEDGSGTDENGSETDERGSGTDEIILLNLVRFSRQIVHKLHYNYI